jgi:hypothetical protein
MTFLRAGGLTSQPAGFRIFEDEKQSSFLLPPGQPLSFRQLCRAALRQMDEGDLTSAVLSGNL